MNKILLSAIICLVAAPASRAFAQDMLPETTRATPIVTVIGAVGVPGAYPFVPGESATALLKRAGGLMRGAAPARMYVLRDGLAISLDLSQIKEDSPQFVLRAGDLLSVPETSRFISVAGNVARPGKFELTEEKQLSVIDALVLAGGLTSSSSKLSIAILRADPTNPEIIVAMHFSPKDFDSLFRTLLQNGDVVYVMSARSGMVGKGGLQLLGNSG